MMKKILAALLCAATVFSLAGCANGVDTSALMDIANQAASNGANTTSNSTGTGKGKRPGTSTGTSTGTVYNADGSINWDAVPYANEADFVVGDMTYDAAFGVNIHCKIIKEYTGSDKLIKIPETINGEPVLELGGEENVGVFHGLSDISVKTPTNVFWIKNCFYDCKNLTVDITQPVPVKDYASEYGGTVTFNEYSFKGCNGVTVNAPTKGVKYINANAFSGCSKVNAISIPDDIVNVAENAFDSGSLPKSIIYKGNTYDASQYNDFINAGHFNDPRPYDGGELGHSTLKILDLYGIGFYSLRGVPRDTKGTYTVPDNVRSIDDYAFTGCKSLENVILHSNVSVSEKAFDGYDGNVTYKGKTYKASEFNFEEAENAASELPLTNWDSVPVAPESDFEYEFLGVLWSEFVSITKYKGTAKQVKIPETIEGVRVGSLFGKQDYEGVFDMIPDIEVLLPKDVSLKHAFTSCGGARLYLPDTGISESVVSDALKNGVSLVYKGVVYDKEHEQDFRNAVNGTGG